MCVGGEGVLGIILLISLNKQLFVSDGDSSTGHKTPTNITHAHPSPHTRAHNQQVAQTRVHSHTQIPAYATKA